MNSLDERPEEGGVYELRIYAKGSQDEGIGKIGEFPVFVKNGKTRLGNVYKVKILKVYRTYAFAELLNNEQKYVNASVIEA
ncbi:MAG: TRAM domain-containing protein [Candidatus Micrarchaeia archaeon]